ncbi:MAG: hypothetical protein EP301_13010, partial [Gammaproteobacteria bacterium]
MIAGKHWRGLWGGCLIESRHLRFPGSLTAAFFPIQRWYPLAVPGRWENSMRGHCRSALGSALVILAIGLAAPVQAADLDPELGGVETMAMPGDHWFMFLNSLDGGSPYSASSGIFDADTGQMQGRLNLSDYTSAVYLDRGRGKIYLPASFYSRGTYGDRTDLLIINDVENLAPVAEIEVPTKLAVVFHRAVINPICGNFVGLYNMTPAMSVSVVDVENQKFVGEISTAGCGFVYPLNGRRFLQLCGDGTVQMIDLDADGQESARQRSRVFFDVDEDPVFDLALEKPDGLVLVTFAGRVFEVTVDGDDIDISSPWSLLSDQDR